MSDIKTTIKNVLDFDGLSHFSDKIKDFVTNITSKLESDKADVDSPTLTGTPKAPTATSGTNTTQIATTAFVQTEIGNLINGAPETANTLKELSDLIEEHQDVTDALDAAIGKKVDKEEGKGLSTNDYTDEDKAKLDGIEENANNYEHPTDAGYKHIPGGGSSGQILKWSSDGTAEWANVSNSGITGDYLEKIIEVETDEFGDWVEIDISNNSLTEILYINNKFIAYGYDGVYYSTDGINWNASSGINGIMNDPYCLAYDNNTFVAAGSDGNIYYSTDGVTWTTSSDVSDISSIVYGNNIFVATGYGVGSYYSSDGITWTIGNNLAIHNIAYGNNTFVECDDNNIYYSSDGVTWNTATFPTNAEDVYFNVVFYAGSKFFVYKSDIEMYYSEDGITWNETTGISGVGMSSGINNVVYFNNYYIANGMDDEGEKTYYSSDGITWTTEGLFDEGYIIYAISDNGDKLMVSGINEDGDQIIYYSENSTTWTTINNVEGTLNNIAYGNGKFVGIIYSSDADNYGIYYLGYATEEINIEEPIIKALSSTSNEELDTWNINISGSVKGALPLIEATDLGIDNTTTLQELAEIIRNRSETRLRTMVWSNQNTYSQLWKDINNKIGRSQQYGYLICEKYTNTVYFDFRLYNGSEIYNWTYSTSNDKGMSGVTSNIAMASSVYSNRMSQHLANGEKLYLVSTNSDDTVYCNGRGFKRDSSEKVLIVKYSHTLEETGAGYALLAASEEALAITDATTYGGITGSTCKTPLGNTLYVVRMSDLWVNTETNSNRKNYTVDATIDGTEYTISKHTLYGAIADIGGKPMNQWILGIADLELFSGISEVTPNQSIFDDLDFGSLDD